VHRLSLHFQHAPELVICARSYVPAAKSIASRRWDILAIYFFSLQLAGGQSLHTLGGMSLIKRTCDVVDFMQLAFPNPLNFPLPARSFKIENDSFCVFISTSATY